MSGGVCRGRVSDVAGSGDDLRVDIRVLDEDRRRARAQRHRRVQCSKTTAELQSPLFFTMPSEDTNVRAPLPAPPPLTLPQERILKVVEFGRVRRPLRWLNPADTHTDRAALRLDSHDHILWLHQELAAAHVHQVRRSLSSGIALTLQIDS
jgi:hypothetical protein